MYKVFIENRPVIICEKNSSKFDSVVLFAEKVSSFEKDVHPLFQKNEPKIPIILLTPNPKMEFKRLFEGYKRVKAAGGIVRRGDEYLFIKREGKWDIPKGKLDKGELPEVGAVREIEEECGISNPEIDHFICMTYHTYRFKNKPTLKKTYWYALNYEGDEELCPQLEEGITKAKWFHRDKFDKVRSKTFNSIREVIDIYLGLHTVAEDEAMYDKQSEKSE